VFKNRVLRKIFGPKREEVIGEWKKLLNEELHDLYSSPNIIQVIKETEVGGARRRYGEKRNTDRVFVGKLEGKRQFGRNRLRWKCTIQVDFDGMAWTGLTWLRTGAGHVAGLCEHCNELLG
jgi:hypothetical protein